MVLRWVKSEGAFVDGMLWFVGGVRSGDVIVRDLFEKVSVCILASQESKSPSIFYRCQGRCLRLL